MEKDTDRKEKTMKDIKRIVSTGFWEDDLVLDMSPEDRYFMLYILTNQYTTQLGIYHFPVRRCALELGYSSETVNVLLDRFQTKYDIIRFSSDTNEIAIKNYLRHSIIKGGKPVMDCLMKEEKQIKDKSLLEFVYLNLSKYIGTDILIPTVEEYLKSLEQRYNYFIINNNTNNNINNDNDNERNVDVTSEIEDFFESVWLLYPNKKGKSAISMSKKKELFKLGYDKISYSVNAYSEEVKGTDIHYVLHGSTFFNGRYKDYLPDENDVIEVTNDVAEGNGRQG